MVAVTTVLGHIWIPLASGRAKRTGLHYTGLSMGPAPLSVRRWSKRKKGRVDKEETGTEKKEEQRKED